MMVLELRSDRRMWLTAVYTVADWASCGLPLVQRYDVVRCSTPRKQLGRSWPIATAAQWVLRTSPRMTVGNAAWPSQ